VAQISGTNSHLAVVPTVLAHHRVLRTRSTHTPTSTHTATHTPAPSPPYSPTPVLLGPYLLPVDVPDAQCREYLGGYGSMLVGYDVSSGTPIGAPAAGIVIEMQEFPGIFGIILGLPDSSRMGTTISDNAGYFSVTANQNVARGEIVGRTGKGQLGGLLMFGVGVDLDREELHCNAFE
jgi:hypothetical protein